MQYLNEEQAVISAISDMQLVQEHSGTCPSSSHASSALQYILSQNTAWVYMDCQGDTAG